MPRRELSISEKIAVIELMKKQPNISQRHLSAITGIPKSTIARIALQKHKIIRESSTLYNEQAEQRRLLSRAIRIKDEERQSKNNPPDVEGEVLRKWYSNNNSITEPIIQDQHDGSEATTKPKPTSETHSAAFSFSQHSFLTEPVDLDHQIKQEEDSEDTFFEGKGHTACIESILMETEPSQADSEMQKKQDSQVAVPPLTPVQLALSQAFPKQETVEQSSQVAVSVPPAPSESTPKQETVDQSLQVTASAQPTPIQSTPEQMAVDQSSQVTATVQPVTSQSTHKQMHADKTSAEKKDVAKPSTAVQSAPYKTTQPLPYYQLAPKLMTSAQLATQQAALGKLTVATSTPVSSQIKILQKATSLFAQPAPRQVIVPMPKTAKTSQPQKKRLLVVSNHQQSVMSSLASLWKSGKFCDVGLGNGSTTVKVHKVVLSAVCPKLLSMFKEEFFSQKFVQVNFPKEVTKEALMAFGEYIYRGVLYLDNQILEQMKIIAKKLDNKDLGNLCDRHLQYNKTEPAALLSNVPSVQPAIPTKTSSNTSFASTTSPFSTSSPAVNTKLTQGQKVEVITLAPNWSRIGINGHSGPKIKAKVVGIWNTDGNNQSFVSIPSSMSSSSSDTVTASSSIVPISSFMEEFTPPLSERGEDVESTKSKEPDSYKTPDLSPLSNIAEKICSKSNPVMIDYSEPLSKSSKLTSSVDDSLTGDVKIYPVELSTAAGDILPLPTIQTVHIKSELCEMDLT